MVTTLASGLILALAVWLVFVEIRAVRWWRAWKMRRQLFGNGRDGDVVMDGREVPGFRVVRSVRYYAERPHYFRTLKIVDGVMLFPEGYAVSVKKNLEVCDDTDSVTSGRHNEGRDTTCES